MAILYSLRLKPNYSPAYAQGNVWNDITDTIDANSPPSIQIAAERADTPLVVSVSDLSLSLVNADNRFDDFFDVGKIVGTLPPQPNVTLRAPLIHYGQIVLCRKSTDAQSWQVMFYGFIDPKSIIFNRAERMVSITAYAPGKLLEQGNAERINRVYHTGANGDVAWARPFVFTDKPLSHPAPAMGSGDVSDSWWKLTGGAGTPGLDLVVVGDQFEVVAATTKWVENAELTKLIDSVFTVASVTAVGDDLYFSTTEPHGLVVSGANLNSLTPWWHGAVWESLVLQLVNEASAALSAMGAPQAIFCDTTNLPLLDTGGMLVSSRIFYADMNVPIPGLAYTKFGGTPTLLILTKWDATTFMLQGKSDILTWGNIPPPLLHGYTFSTPAPPAAAVALSIVGMHTINVTANGAQPDYNSVDPVIGPLGVHTFNGKGQPQTNNTGGGRYKSSHVVATPSSFLNAGLGHRSFWEIISFSQFTTGGPGNPPALKQGIQIARYQTDDGGATWTLPYNHNDLTDYANDDGVPWASAFQQCLLNGAVNGAEFGQSWRPSIKVFKTGGSSYLYCWIDPIMQGAYYKTSTTDEEATSNFFFPRPTAFLSGGSADAPINSSGFVQERADGTVYGPVWLFDERADGTGISLFYWNGSGFSVGNIVDASGRGLSLTGGDFINAIVDCTRTPHKFYVVIGQALYTLTYTWSAPNFTVSDWQAVDLDDVNFNRDLESADLGVVSHMNAVAWLAAPVQQHFPNEPNYLDASDAVLVGTLNTISVVSDTPPNTVDVADFEGKSCAAALSDLLMVRGYQMITGANADQVADPTSFDPSPLIKFRPRLKAITDTTAIDLSSYTEACEDGVWFLNYSAVAVENKKQKLGPMFNDTTLSDVAGNKYTIKPTRYAGSAALTIDSPMILSRSMMRLLANIFAGEFLIPRTTANIVIRDPFIEGQPPLGVLDVVKFLRRGKSDTSTVVLYGQGRLMSIDYGLESKLLTLRIT